MLNQREQEKHGGIKKTKQQAWRCSMLTLSQWCTRWGELRHYSRELTLCKKVAGVSIVVGEDLCELEESFEENVFHQKGLSDWNVTA